MEERDEGEIVDYSLTLSAIHHRVRNLQNNFSDEAYYDLVQETDGIYIENGFTKGIDGIRYSVESHSYLIEKFDQYENLHSSDYKAVFNSGIYVKRIDYPTDENLALIEAEKTKLLGKIKNLKAESAEWPTFSSEATIIRNVENMVSTFNLKYEMFVMSDSHYKVEYDSNSLQQQKQFSLFFNWYLASLTPFDVGGFLKFHLKDSFSNNFKEFRDFITNTVSDDKYGLISEKLLGVVNGEIVKLERESQAQSNSQSKVFNIEKINWLGTQKELAELFIELHRKGFLKEIPKNLSDHFDKATTINDILKPLQDTLTYEPTYARVFTARYKCRFSEILKNLNS